MIYQGFISLCSELRKFLLPFGKIIMDHQQPQLTMLMDQLNRYLALAVDRRNRTIV